MELDDFRSFPAPGSRLRNHAPCRNRTYNAVIKSFFYGFFSFFLKGLIFCFPSRETHFYLSRHFSILRQNQAGPYHLTVSPYLAIFRDFAPLNPAGQAGLVFALRN